MDIRSTFTEKEIKDYLENIKEQLEKQHTETFNFHINTTKISEILIQ
jgi:hypothetical protein